MSNSSLFLFLHKRAAARWKTMLRTPGALSGAGQQKLRSFMGSRQAAAPGKLTTRPLGEKMRISTTPGHRQPKITPVKAPAGPKVQKEPGVLKQMGPMLALEEIGKGVTKITGNEGVGSQISSAGMMLPFMRRKAAALASIRHGRRPQTDMEAQLGILLKTGALSSSPDSDASTNPVQLAMNNDDSFPIQDRQQEVPGEHNPGGANESNRSLGGLNQDDGMHGKLRESVQAAESAILG